MRIGEEEEYECLNWKCRSTFHWLADKGFYFRTGRAARTGSGAFAQMPGAPHCPSCGNDVVRATYGDRTECENCGHVFSR